MNSRQSVNMSNGPLGPLSENPSRGNINLYAVLAANDDEKEDQTNHAAPTNSNGLNILGNTHVGQENRRPQQQSGRQQSIATAPADSVPEWRRNGENPQPQGWGDRSGQTNSAWGIGLIPAQPAPPAPLGPPARPGQGAQASAGPRPPHRPRRPTPPANIQRAERLSAATSIPRPLAPALPFEPDTRRRTNLVIGTNGPAYRNSADGDRGQRTLSGVLFADQIVGQIYERPWITQIHHINDVHQHDINFVRRFTHHGLEIMLLIKVRSGLVISRAKRSVQEVPIKSFGNRGIEGKDKDTHRQYASLCPPGVDLATFRNQVPENPVVRVEAVNKQGDLSRELQVLDLADAQWRDVNADDLRKVGRAYKEDVEALLPTVRELIGYTPPADKMI